MNAQRLLVGSAAAWLLATGCVAGTGAVDLKTLPAAPVAILYRDEAMAMDRVDTIADLKKRSQPSEKEGVMRLETLDGLFGGTPDAQRRLQDLSGHFALFDPRSSEVTVVEGVPPGAKPLAWSPDRSQLMLAGRFREGVQLFVWDRASGEVEMVSAGPSDHPMGCIGPAGRLVAVEARRIQGQYQGRLLATPPGTTAGLRPVSPGPSDVLPACSPNSSLIAYVTAGDDGLLTVAVRDLDTPSEAPRMIGRGTDPVFTPDGAWIVYSATVKQGSRLFRVRPDGTGRTPIGAGLADEADPTVSPDGAFVAYVGQDDDERERLRVRRFDGTGDRPFLTSGDGDAPVW